MRCLNPEVCPCLSHVDPSTHVPSCFICRTPLVPWDGDPEYGICLNGLPSRGKNRCATRGQAIPPDEWAWLPRDTFMSSDLPPGNGWAPIQIRENSL